MLRAGFTLIEMLAVVVLIGLLAGAVAYSMTGEVRRSSREDLLGELEYFDRITRTAARRFDEQRVLAIDLDRQRVRRIDRPGKWDEKASARIAVGDGLSIDRVWIAAGDATPLRANGRTEARQEADGEVEVPFDPMGQSATYAVRIAGPERTGWIVFAGLTGEPTRTDDDQAVDRLFESLERGRPHTD